MSYILGATEDCCVGFHGEPSSQDLGVDSRVSSYLDPQNILCLVAVSSAPHRQTCEECLLRCRFFSLLLSSRVPRGFQDCRKSQVSISKAYKAPSLSSSQLGLSPDTNSSAELNTLNSEYFLTKLPEHLQEHPLA